MKFSSRPFRCNRSEIDGPRTASNHKSSKHQAIHRCSQSRLLRIFADLQVIADLSGQPARHPYTSAEAESSLEHFELLMVCERDSRVRLGHLFGTSPPLCRTLLIPLSRTHETKSACRFRSATVPTPRYSVSFRIIDNYLQLVRVRTFLKHVKFAKFFSCYKLFDRVLKVAHQNGYKAF